MNIKTSPGLIMLEVDKIPTAMLEIFRNDNINKLTNKQKRKYLEENNISKIVVTVNDFIEFLIYADKNFDFIKEIEILYLLREDGKDKAHEILDYLKKKYNQLDFASEKLTKYKLKINRIWEMAEKN